MRIKIIKLYSNYKDRNNQLIRKTIEEIESETNEFCEFVELNGGEIINIIPITTSNNPAIDSTMIIYKENKNE